MYAMALIMRNVAIAMMRDWLRNVNVPLTLEGQAWRV